MARVDYEDGVVLTEAWLDQPEALWAATRLGREEYVQKLLATLVLGEPARGWNVPRPPSARGATFLRSLHAAAFDDTPAADPIFVDEFELPARDADESAGWPDHGVIWPELLFLIELKTERASHRRGQLPHYLDLAAHHHPNVDVDLLYLTPTMEVPAPVKRPERSSYALMHWPEVYGLVRDVWADSPVGWETTITAHLERWIGDIEAGAPLPERALPAATPPEVDWLELAAAVHQDGRQRAGELAVDDPEELEELRIELRDRLREGPVVDGAEVTNVMPWIWRAETSGGRPLTDLGASTGYELRLSRYVTDQTQPS